MDTQSTLPEWREKALYLSPEAAVFAVLAFTAVKFPQLGIEFFLSFAILLCGVGMIGKMLLLWGGRKLSAALMLSGCVAGSAFIGIAAAEFGVIASWWEPIFILVFLFGVALWRRSRRVRQAFNFRRHFDA